MKQFAKELGAFILHYEPLLKLLSEEAYLRKDSPGKWSRKEEFGHLIDSAQNNLRRFLVTEYENNPKIVYDQDAWVKSSNYQYQHAESLVTFWVCLTRQICDTLESMPAACADRMCDTGNEKTELHSLRYLAEDYIRHMRHHLYHVLEL